MIDESPIPKYPLPRTERFDATSHWDWRPVIVRLVIHSLIIGFVAVLLLVMALVITGGQLLRLFELAATQS